MSIHVWVYMRKKEQKQIFGFNYSLDEIYRL